MAQTTQPASSPNPQTVSPVPVTQPNAPTAGEIMRERISKAKAFIAVRNYNAAIYELENIRRETADASVQAVVNVLLMNSYLEQGDYKRAQDFLNQAYLQQKTPKPNAAANYFAIASQVVKSARNRVERYRALGLNVSDRTLPLEAVNDLEKMRETLEVVITQSKEVGKEKAKTQDAMALLEEAANSRSLMARDDYDARRWKDEVADTREQVASSRSVVVNAVNDGVPDMPVAQNNQTTASMSSAPPSNQTTASVSPADNKPVFQPVVPDSNRASRPIDSPATTGSVQKIVMQSPINSPASGADRADLSASTAAGDLQRPERSKSENTPAEGAAASAGAVDNGSSENRKPEKTERPRTLIISNPQPKADDAEQRPNASGNTAEPTKQSGPIDVGSLLAYATRQTSPVYPPAAKNMRATGIVRVEVTVDENGDVAEVQKTSGPALLQGAAKEAIKKWRFKPFVRDGQAVRATGFVNFNFSL